MKTPIPITQSPRKRGRPLTHRPTVRLYARVRLATRLALIERAGGPCKIGVLLDSWAEHDARIKAERATAFNYPGHRAPVDPWPSAPK